MESNDVRVWGIHTRDDHLFLKTNVIAIGWKKMGDLNTLKGNRESFKEKYFEVYPESSTSSIATSAGMLFRFMHEVQKGDYVIYPSKRDRMVNIGIIEGDYSYHPDAPEYSHQRKVKWIKHMPRTSFSQGALYEIGSALTFFLVKSYAEEFLETLREGNKDLQKIITDENYSIADRADEIIEATRDFVLKELSKNLKGYPLEELVADLLEAMGYKATLLPQGGDHGTDIIAYKDELPPRINVQVKSQSGNISETLIHSLKGAMREGDYGLFITLSDYSKNAQKFLSNNPIIRGINGTELVDLILKYYDRLSEKHKRIIPLKMVYIPVAKSNDD